MVAKTDIDAAELAAGEGFNEGTVHRGVGRAEGPF